MTITDVIRPETAGMLLIFFARILDVSIGTMRIILISRGYRILAPVFGFFEVILWLLAMNQVMKHIDNTYSYLVYGAGFATGNYVGMLLESKIAIGFQAIRVITTEKLVSLPLILRQEGYGVTSVKGMGALGEVTIIFSIIPRKKLDHVLEIIRILEPNAFITIEDVRTTSKGFFGEKITFPRILGRHVTKKK